MKKNGFGLCAAVTSILLAGQVSAQTGVTPLEGWPRSSQITGMTVINPQGEKLGKIDDLLIDPKRRDEICDFVPWRPTWGLATN